MDANDKRSFYNSYKNTLLCNKICSRFSISICCPELMPMLCPPKRKMLEEMLECDREARENKGYEFKHND